VGPSPDEAASGEGGSGASVWAGGAGPVALLSRGSCTACLFGLGGGEGAPEALRLRVRTRAPTQLPPSNRVTRKLRTRPLPFRSSALTFLLSSLGQRPSASRLVSEHARVGSSGSPAQPAAALGVAAEALKAVVEPLLRARAVTYARACLLVSSADKCTLQSQSLAEEAKALQVGALLLLLLHV